MATLIWSTIFYVLVLEVIIVMFLLSPLPSSIKRRMTDMFARVFALTPIQSFRIPFYFLCVGLLMESIRQMSYIKEETDLEINRTQSRLEMFRAQRNVYITFFVLFFFYAIDRLVSLVTSHARLEINLETLKKQAKQSQKAFEASNTVLPQQLEEMRLKVKALEKEKHDRQDKLDLVQSEVDTLAPKDTGEDTQDGVEEAVVSEIRAEEHKQAAAAAEPKGAVNKKND